MKFFARTAFLHSTFELAVVAVIRSLVDTKIVNSILGLVVDAGTIKCHINIMHARAFPAKSTLGTNAIIKSAKKYLHVVFLKRSRSDGHVVVVVSVASDPVEGRCPPSEFGIESTFQ